jgi:serine/threonine-protein kinase RsbW
MAELSPVPLPDVCLPGRQSAVRGALVAVERALAPLKLLAEERARVELVLAEVLNNIVTHALDADREGRIRISFRLGAGGLCVTIRDPGRAMPWERLPQGGRPDFSAGLMALPEGGFGWFLIRQLSQDVDYRRTAEGNTLSFCLPVGTGRQLRPAPRPARLPCP